MFLIFVRFAMPLGGVIGRMLNIRLFAVVPEFPFRRETVAAVASLVMLAAFSYTVDVTAGQWRRGIKKRGGSGLAGDSSDRPDAGRFAAFGQKNDTGAESRETGGQGKKGKTGAESQG